MPWLILALALLLPRPAPAQIYSEADLDVVRGSMADNLELMATVDIPKALPVSRRARATGVSIVFTDAGDNPLAFWSRPDRQAIHVPLESVRFFDDLSILFAWFERNGCRGEYIQSYLYALLREGRPMGPPLAAFGLDRETALRDAFVDDVSGKLLKSGIQFILAHEMGHLMLDHRPGLTGAASQRQEMAADAFALDVFAEQGAPPAGVVIYFLAGRWRDPIGASALESTHPVSPDRIAAVARRMAESPGDFSFAEPDRENGRQQVMMIARELGRIAALTSDEQMLTLLPIGLKDEFPTEALRMACPG